MSKFQLILTTVFIFIIIAAVATFALFKASDTENRGKTVLWGTLDRQLMSSFLSKVGEFDQKFSVDYVEKRPETFEADLIEALASGTGPDAVLLPQDLIYRNLNKLTPIPYSSLSERSFKDTYLSEGELFLSAAGISALPLVVDPLVLYWNRTLLTNAGIAKPPATWTELLALTPKLVAKNNTVITQSAVALGGYENITNAKDILSVLLLQAGTPITGFRDSGRLASLLGEKFNFALVPAEEALRFYIGFADPQKPNYSWNPSLPPARSYFISGDLAFYLGFASELKEIRDRNPNLDFDVATLPQTDKTVARKTFGRVLGLAFTKNLKDLPSAFANALSLTSPNSIRALSEIISLPPSRRDLLSVKPADAYLAVFYDSALISRGWLDPDKEGSDAVFKNMVKSATSGRARISEAVGQASRELESLIK